MGLGRLSHVWRGMGGVGGVERGARRSSTSVKGCCGGWPSAFFYSVFSSKVDVSVTIDIYTPTSTFHTPM